MSTKRNMLKFLTQKLKSQSLNEIQPYTEKVSINQHVYRFIMHCQLDNDTSLQFTSLLYIFCLFLTHYTSEQVHIVTSIWVMSQSQDLNCNTIIYLNSRTWNTKLSFTINPSQILQCVQTPTYMYRQCCIVDSTVYLFILHIYSNGMHRWTRVGSYYI